MIGGNYYEKTFCTDSGRYAYHLHGGHRVRRHAHHQGAQRQDSDCQSSRDQGFGQLLGQVVRGASHQHQAGVI